MDSSPRIAGHQREREKTLKELKKAAGEGAFGSIIGSSADIRTKLTVTEERTRRLRDSIRTFRVHPEYHELEQEASELTGRLANLSNENTIDRELIFELEQAMTIESAPSYSDLELLYRETGVVLPTNTLRRFDEVKAFHDAVVNNRKIYLQGEMEAARERVMENEKSMETLSDRRAEIMNVLNSHGALEHFNKLQSELTKVETETEALRQQFSAAEQLEGRKTELDFERRKIQMRLRQDHSEQEDVIRRAILAFSETSSSLYEEAGELTIDSDSLNGPQFDVKIQGSKSKGINNMQIFCFDMMLMKICSERGIGPGFLIHDSHLFDGVDERQVAKALQIAAQMASKLKFQYIVTMNSDVIPKELPPGFDLHSYVLPVRLTDATEDGGVFGFRFS